MRSVPLQKISTFVLSFLLCLAVSFSHGAYAQTDAADGAAAEATAGAATAGKDAAPLTMPPLGQANLFLKTTVLRAMPSPMKWW